MPKKRKPKPIKVRRSWKLNPRSRVKESAKAYRRPKSKSDLRKNLLEPPDGNGS